MLFDGGGVAGPVEHRNGRGLQQHRAAIGVSAFALIVGSIVIGTGLAGAMASGSTLPAAPAVPMVKALPGSLGAVSCPAPDDCIAVGSYTASGSTNTLAEFWNGATWTVQPTPNPSGGSNNMLGGVSCTSADSCLAVGSYFEGRGNNLLAETWNGANWTLQTAPLPAGGLGGSFDGVSCSSATACSAVGSYADSGNQNESLAESWDGAAFTVETVTAPGDPTTNTLDAVSCSASPSLDCMAVGWYFESGAGEVAISFASSWNGTTWTSQQTPVPNGALGGAYPSGVSCRTPKACIAVGEEIDGSGGNGFGWAQSWNGKTWSNQTTANPTSATASVLGAVSCSVATTNACMAVGAYYNGTTFVNFAEQLKGSRWSDKVTPEPKGSTDAELQGVSCSTPAGTCSAVGYVTNSAAAVVTVADGWNGKKWAVQKTPQP
jgi:hypothetical protein